MHRQQLQIARNAAQIQLHLNTRGLPNGKKTFNVFNHRITLNTNHRITLNSQNNHSQQQQQRTYKVGTLDPKVLPPPTRTLEYPEEHRPQPVEYNGPERLHAAYVLDRLPRLIDEEHPLIQDFEEVRNHNTKFYARHQWVDFFDYQREWKKHQGKAGVSAHDSAEKKKSKGQAQEKSQKSATVTVPDPPEMTEQEKLEYNRSFVSVMCDSCDVIRVMRFM